MERIWEKHYPAGVQLPLAYPELTVPELFEQAVNQFPQRPAIIFAENVISYSQLDTMSRSLALNLSEAGVGPRDHIALFMNNCPQFVISLFAILQVGAIAVNNISPMSVGRELAAIFLKNRVRALIIETSLWHKIKPYIKRLKLRLVIFTDSSDLTRPLLPGRQTLIPESHEWSRGFLNMIDRTANDLSTRTGPDDVALFQLTGGSTGTPKAAMLTHRNLVANVTQTRSYLNGLRDSWQVTLANMPFIHIYGVTIGIIRSLCCGWSIVLMPRFSVRGVIETMGRYPVTILHSVPILYSGLIDLLSSGTVKRDFFSRIKLAGCGSAPLPEKVFKRFFQLTGIQICQGYGLTENSPVVCSHHPDARRRSGSVGFPMPGIDIRIINPDNGQECTTGEIGELLVKGPQVMKGYYNHPEETEMVLKNEYLHTGDLALIDNDGYVFITGRKKDMIVSGGYNIYPAEVDEVLLDHPQIADACTIGIPDDYRGEVIMAFIVPVSGQVISASDVTNYCKENLSKYKVPFRIEFKQELPRDPVRKIRRKTLLAQYLKSYGNNQKQDWKIF